MKPVIGGTKRRTHSQINIPHATKERKQSKGVGKEGNRIQRGSPMKLRLLDCMHPLLLRFSSVSREHLSFFDP